MSRECVTPSISTHDQRNAQWAPTLWSVEGCRTLLVLPLDGCLLLLAREGLHC